MNFNTFLDTIVNIKHLQLLGEEAHAKLSPPYRLQLAEKNKEKQIKVIMPTMAKKS